MTERNLRYIKEAQHFRWVNGMSAYDEQTDKEFIVFVENDKVYGLSQGGVVSELPDEAELLDSPSTRGCLLSLIREKHPTAYIEARFLGGGTYYLVQFQGREFFLDHRTSNEFDALWLTLEGLGDCFNNSTRNLFLLKTEIDARSRIIDDYANNPKYKGDTWVMDRITALVSQLVEYNKVYRAEAAK